VIFLFSVFVHGCYPMIVPTSLFLLLFRVLEFYLFFFLFYFCICYLSLSNVLSQKRGSFQIINRISWVGSVEPA
jgi:hypothetical protein